MSDLRLQVRYWKQRALTTRSVARAGLFMAIVEAAAIVGLLLFS